MPLSRWMTKQLALEVWKHLQGAPECGNCQSERIEKALDNWFKDKIVQIHGPGTIEIVADDMGLRVADDEIEEIAAKIQDHLDGDRCPLHVPGLEGELEHYLEYTEDGERKNAPDFWVVCFDDTADWDQDFLKKHHIGKIESVYLVDKNEVTHCAEAAASYCFYYVGYVAEHEDKEHWQISDEADMEIMTAPAQDIRYIHVNTFGCMDRKEQHYRPEPLTTDMYKDEESYREMCQQLIEDYRANPVW